MIPPKKPQIAQSRLDPSDPGRGRFGKGPAGAAALAACMAFIALAFIAFIGKGAAGAAALATFMAFIAMHDGPAPRVKRATENEVPPQMPMRETSSVVKHSPSAWYKDDGIIVNQNVTNLHHFGMVLKQALWWYTIVSNWYI